MILIFIPVMLIMFYLIITILYRASNWSDLEYFYPYNEEDKITTKYLFQSIRINSVGFNSCVCIGLNNNGLYFKIMFPFINRFEDVFIPWHNIHISEDKILWFIRYEAEIDKIENTSIVFVGRISKKIVAYQKYLTTAST